MARAKDQHNLPEDILFDVRLVERHIQRGLTTREAVAKRTEAMPDLDARADRIDLDALAAAGRGKRPS